MSQLNDLGNYLGPKLEDHRSRIQNIEDGIVVDAYESYASFANLPTTGKTNIFYVTADNDKMYRWNGSSYIEVVASSDNTFSAGTGINIVESNNNITISHSDTSTVGSLSVNNSNGTVLQDLSLTFDGFGHVTGTSIVSIDLDNRYQQLSQKGIANGYASLDSNGLVPSSQLPSYVDDVLEFTNLTGFPGTGETSKIYVALDTNKIYRWSGSVYVEVSSDTNNFLSGLTFNTTDGILTATRSGLSNLTVDLDGRYSLSTHTHNYAGSSSAGGAANTVVVTDHTSNDVNYPVVWHNNSNTLYDTGSKFTFNPSTGSLNVNRITTSLATFNGNILIGSNKVDFKTNGSLTAPQLQGARGTTDLNSRLFADEGGFSYTTYDSSALNKPDGTTNNANGVFTFNTHSASAYTHQLAFNNTGGIHHRISTGAWKEFYTSANSNLSTVDWNTKNLSVTGNISVTGTVGGRDLSVDGNKLDGIESGATADMTANEILTAIKTVDGSGSGLNADLLDGLDSSQFLRSDTADTFTSLSGTSLTIGAGVTLAESAVRADLLEIKSSTSTWGGIQITNTLNEFKWSFMCDGTIGGIYDDLSNAWHIQFSDGGGTRLYQAGAEKLTTTTTGVSITGTITESSDKRLKENIKPLNDSLNKVLNLQGVEYNLIEQPGKTEIGFIAQEVQEIVPELVETNENDMLSVSYQRTVALLVEAIKEQQEEINKLKDEINNLKGVN